MGFISSLTAWAKQPFTSSMDIVHWALFTGLVLVLVVAWTRVLNHVVD